MRDVGRRVILPLSFIGSARHMFEVFQDSMAITHFFLHPDIFGTMMANPKWVELLDALQPFERKKDHLELVASVFEMKRKEMIEDVYHRSLFGNAVARVHTIEFQK